MNTLLRNLLSNAAIKMTSNNLVVIGAGLQMIIFALNVTMLVCLSPYKSTFVVKSETRLTKKVRKEIHDHMAVCTNVDRS